jgi:surfeit locus 1 family protein
MSAGYSFRPRLWAFALAAAACAAGIALGNWQSRRAEEKRELARPVAVEGEFVAQHTVFLDNKTRRGRYGFEVVTPLRVRGSDAHVLVNRGWVEGAKTRDALPQVATPAGNVRIEGLALERPPRLLKLGSTSGKVRQSLDFESFAAESGLKLEPRIIEQHSALPDGLARDWASRESGAQKSEAYALQWYSLAALAVVLFLVLSFKKGE